MDLCHLPGTRGTTCPGEPWDVRWDEYGNEGDAETQVPQVLKDLAAKHQGVEIIPLDISEPSSVKDAATRVTERLKGVGLTLLINNAGIARVKAMEAETPEDMSEVYKTNVIGPMMVVQAFLPLLRKASLESPQNGMSCSKAAIVNISSEAGSITNPFLWEQAHVVNYRCSKAALNMLTRCQSLGYANDKILCIALHPGFVQTDMTGGGLLTVNESVQSILKTLSHLSEKDTGTFVNWQGDVLPW
ncbi:C-signal isoform X2 [Zootoca vivipara]|uniref:C-signal isoform X2 n=1 Tax=Zootoca vivipara TaxID=8524 RepID=UPI0015914DBC|nr:C-signal isoform X2 [Zootoca vivipara]